MSLQYADRPVTDRPVRRLSLTDLPACIALAGDREWPADEPKWRLLFAVSEAYGIDDPSGGLAGTVVLTRYGTRLAVVGMMLVASRHERRGLGRRLMTHILALADGAVVYLFATDYGRPLYARLGFRVVDTSVRHVGIFAPDESAAPIRAPRPVPVTDVTRLAAADLPVFGADRGLALTELAGLAGGFVECGEPVAGYAAAWCTGDTQVIGPVVADDAAMAETLISVVAGACTGPVRLDVFGRCAELGAWADAHGLQAAGSTAVMALGGPLPGDRSRLFAPANVALG